MEVVGAGTAGVVIGWHGCVVLRPKFGWRSIGYSLILMGGFGVLAYWFGGIDGLIADAAGMATGIVSYIAACSALRVRAKRDGWSPWIHKR